MRNAKCKMRIEAGIHFRRSRLLYFRRHSKCTSVSSENVSSENISSQSVSSGERRKNKITLEKKKYLYV